MLNLIKTGRLNRRMHQLRADVEATNRQTIASDADHEFLLIKTTPAQQTAKEEGKRKAREDAESGTFTPTEDELVEVQHPLPQPRRKEEPDELDAGAGGFLMDDDGDSQDTWIRGRAEVGESGIEQVSEGGGFLIDSDDDSAMDPTTLRSEQTVHFADDEDEHSLISRRRRMERQQGLLSNMSSGASGNEQLVGEPHEPIFSSGATTVHGPTKSHPSDNGDEDDALLQMALESSLLEHRPPGKAGPTATSKGESTITIPKKRRKGEELEEEELQRALELSLAQSDPPTHARQSEPSRGGEEPVLVLDSCYTTEGDASAYARSDSPSQGAETSCRDDDDGDEIFIQVAMDESEPNPFDEIFGHTSSDAASAPEKRQPNKKLDKGKEKVDIESFYEDDDVADIHRGSAARSVEVSATHAGEETIVIDDDDADEEDNGGSLPADVSLSYDDDEALAMLLQRQEEEEAMTARASGGTSSYNEDQTDEDSAAIKRQFYEEMGMVGAKAGRTEDDVEREMSQEALTLSRRARAMHTTSSLTHDAITDCVTLLQLFGCPYVVAPMEAEAQCGFLDNAGLVHGVITEDSDIFLVGGQTVYRNVFSKRRQVEVYTMSDIKTHLALDREKLISLALLLGSDYTEGVKGVGVATAMEIIGLFDTLADFKAWWQASPGDSNDLHADADKRLGWLRNKVTLRHDFPSEAVADAYQHPQVDESQERFEWGLPDIDGLRRFARGKMGWPDEKVDELVLPILKRFAEAEHAAQDPSSAGLQTSIDDFFAASSSVSSNRRLNPRIKSARVQNAVLRMLGREPVDEAAGTSQHKTKGKNSSSSSKTGGREAVVLQPRSTVVKRRAPSPTAGAKKQKQQQQQEDGEVEQCSSSDVKGELANAEAEGEGAKAMTVNELKAELRKRGQRVTGRKEELVQRLKDALRRERTWEEERNRTQQKEEEEQEQDDDEEKRDEEPGAGEAHKELAEEEEAEATVVDIVGNQERRRREEEEERGEALKKKKSRRRIVIP